MREHANPRRLRTASASHPNRAESFVNSSYGRRMPARPAAAESSYRAASASPEKASFLIFQDMWTRQSNRERGTRQTADSEMRVLHAGFGNNDIMIPKRPMEHRLKMRH